MRGTLTQIGIYRCERLIVFLTYIYMYMYTLMYALLRTNLPRTCNPTIAK